MHTLSTCQRRTASRICSQLTNCKPLLLKSLSSVSWSVTKINGFHSSYVPLARCLCLRTCRSKNQKRSLIKVCNWNTSCHTAFTVRFQKHDMQPTLQQQRRTSMLYQNAYVAINVKKKAKKGNLKKRIVWVLSIVKHK